jgi:hypothetical protein
MNVHMFKDVLRESSSPTMQLLGEDVSEQLARVAAV